MKHIPRISDTEWELMRVVWAHHPISAAEIIERLIATDSTWHPKTARTLLARLVQKQALDYETQGRTYVYEPRVTERECVAAASESFVERVFGGSLQPMLAHFVEQRRISKRELTELQQILENASASTVEKAGRKPCQR
jgi:BlaI family penicillinase repressor